MPRQKPHLKIYPTDLAEIDRLVSLMNIRIRHAGIGLTPFKDHYNALTDLREAMQRALNILNDRDPDYQEPHRGHGYGIPPRA